MHEKNLRKTRSNWALALLAIMSTVIPPEEVKAEEASVLDGSIARIEDEISPGSAAAIKDLDFRLGASTTY